MRARAFAAIVLAIGVMAGTPAQAAQVEVAPGIVVTQKEYRVPANEAPFFNFIKKTLEQRNNDERFVSSILSQVPDRTEAANEAITRGWKFVQERDFATAAKRFNQAYLLDPNESGLYHGFAVIAFERFGDVEYADELFRTAARAHSPLPTLSGDHGLVLLGAGRAAEAKPFLEKSMREVPDWHVPRINLALAMIKLGDRDGACDLIEQIPPEDVPAVADGIVLVRKHGGC